MTSPWRNRIVGSGEEAPDQLVGNPRNWRRHPGPQRDALRGSLSEVGWVRQILVNRTTGNVVDGHARVEEALSRGEETVPVLYVELTEEEEALVLASLDPITGMATRDDEQLRELLASISVEEPGLSALLESIGHDDGYTFGERMDEWNGMPGFEQNDLTSWKHIVVHFRSEGDLARFLEVVGQKLPPGKGAMWYPEEPFGRLATKRYATGEG